ncbi:MAG: TetR/AcrR family transcriptional regulator C-terminal domain-containing protein [Eubacteriales bacterium]
MKRTVYNHFGSKEGLFQAVVNDFLAQRQALKTIVYDPARPLEEQLLAFAKAEIFLIDSPRRIGLSRVLTTVFLQDANYAMATVAKYPPLYDMFLLWLQGAIQDHKIMTADPVMAARIFYALVQGAITYPAMFSNGANLATAKPLLDEIVSIFLTKYRV